MNKGTSNKLTTVFTLSVYGIIAITFITIIMYMVTSFANAELNPLHWSDNVREFLAYLWVCFVVGATVTVIAFSSD